LQVRWNQLSINSQGSTPKNSPSPKPKRVYKPHVRAEKGPDNIYELAYISNVPRTLSLSAYLLCLILMGQASAQSPLPPPPNQFYNRTIQQFKSLDQDPDDPNATSLPIEDVHGINNDKGELDQDYINYIVGQMRAHGILFFTMDWGAHVDDQFNQLMIQFFVKVWKWGLTGNWFKVAAKQAAIKIKMDDMILTPIFVKHFKYLQGSYKKLIKDKYALAIEQEKNTKGVALNKFTSSFHYIL
ncbi:hypothetical protein DFH28DRAFT_912833, partial [Melampsora americana]